AIRGPDRVLLLVVDDDLELRLDRPGFVHDTLLSVRQPEVRVGVSTRASGSSRRAVNRGHAALHAATASRTWASGSNNATCQPSSPSVGAATGSIPDSPSNRNETPASEPDSPTPMAFRHASFSVHSSAKRRARTS